MTTDVRFEEVTVPDAGWLGELTDEWLRDLVAERFARGGTWNVVVGYALSGRLLDSSGRARAVRDLLDKRVNPQMARPLAWVRTLTPSQVQTIETLALSAVDALEDAVEGLAEVDAPRRRARLLLDICHRRDDIEAVLGLLRNVDAGAGLAAAVHASDQAVSEVVEGMAPVAVPPDERIERMDAAVLDGWWTAPVRWGHSAGDVVRGPFIQLPTIAFLAPRVAAAAAGATTVGDRLVEAHVERYDVCVRVTAADQLEVEVTSDELPVEGIGVTLERVADDQVAFSRGPRQTDIDGRASFGPAADLPPAAPGELYRVRVDVLR